MSVAHSGKCCDVHQPDEELVGADCVPTGRQVVDRRLENGRGEIVKEVRMVMAKMLGEQLDVIGGRPTGCTSGRDRTNAEHQRERDAREPAQRFLRILASTSSAHASEARACAYP